MGAEGRESGVGLSGGGLYYIFFAGNRVMTDFKCYFHCLFFTSRNLFWSLKIDAGRNGYVPILILYFLYWRQSARGGWDLIYLFNSILILMYSIFTAKKKT